MKSILQKKSGNPSVPLLWKLSCFAGQRVSEVQNVRKRCTTQLDNAQKLQWKWLDERLCAMLNLSPVVWTKCTKFAIMFWFSSIPGLYKRLDCWNQNFSDWFIVRECEKFFSDLHWRIIYEKLFCWSSCWWGDLLLGCGFASHIGGLNNVCLYQHTLAQKHTLYTANMLWQLLVSSVLQCSRPMLPACIFTRFATSWTLGRFQRLK